LAAARLAVAGLATLLATGLAVPALVVAGLATLAVTALIILTRIAVLIGHLSPR
jgi:hypothetical protein